MHPALSIPTLAKNCVTTITEVLRKEFLYYYEQTKAGMLPKGARLVTSYVKTPLRKKEPFTIIGDRLIKKIDRTMVEKFEQLKNERRYGIEEVFNYTLAELTKPDFSHYADVIRESENLELPSSRFLRTEVTRLTLKTFQAHL